MLTDILTNWLEQIQRLGKPQWRTMLDYTAVLHVKCTHPADELFPYPWEEIGTGYCYGPAYGHWDIIHAALDALPCQPVHFKHQLMNYVSLQEKDGLVPGSIWLRGGQTKWSKDMGHPPVWPAAVQDYYIRYDEPELLELCYPILVKQLGWFNTFRKAEGNGYYYTDILNNKWESGVDDGIRFDRIASGPFACIDATAHVYQMYEHAAEWALQLGHDRDRVGHQRHADELKRFMQDELFDPETGFFHDSWAVGNPDRRPLSHEGMWPVVTGAATHGQAMRVIDENLLAPDRFFSEHPITSIAMTEPLFELRMWRGPAWNSITYWAARGCLRYGRKDAARLLLERALDMTALQFERTGTIWEFYHPHGGDQAAVERKPYTRFNRPCRDYLGHNPLLAMAALWEEVKDGALRFE